MVNPHPSGRRVAAEGVRRFNEAIYRDLGIDNLSASSPSRPWRSAEAIFKHRDVNAVLRHRRAGRRPRGHAAGETGDRRRAGQSAGRRR